MYIRNLQSVQSHQTDLIYTTQGEILPKWRVMEFTESFYLNTDYLPKRVIEAVHLASVERYVLLGIVRRCRAGCEAFGDRFLDVRRVVLR